MKSKDGKSGLSESFIVGTIAIVFLIVGYQTALFIHRAAVMKVVADRDMPDTVFVYREGGFSDARNGRNSGPDGRSDARIAKGGSRQGGTGSQTGGSRTVTERKDAEHSPLAESVRKNTARRTVETFRFNPNTATVEELCRLGFTPKQAQSIDNYRQQGGRFRRKSDFAKSFVVSDSVFRRLEPYIDIPLLDLNLADSAAFDALPGIGGWFASRMIAHRRALGGYSYKEQLMDIGRFDEERFRALEDLVTVSPENVRPYPLWSLPADSLQKHPYIGNREVARSIVLYRENTPKALWSVESLGSSGILSASQCARLSKCAIAAPQ